MEDSGHPSMVTHRTHRPLKPSIQQAQLSNLGLDQLFSGNPRTDLSVGWKVMGET